MKKKIKIIHLTNHFWPSIGGLERDVQELAEHLDPNYFENKVICLNRDHNGEKLSANDRLGNITIQRIPLQLDLKYYKIAPIWNALKDCDVIHVHGMGFWLDWAVLTKWFHHKPVVFSTYGGVFHTTNLQSIKNAYFYGIEPHMLKHVDAVLAISKADEALFKPVAPQTKLVPFGATLPTTKKITKKPLQFITVGRISANKQLEKVIESVQPILNQYKKAKLVIVGPDWDGLGKKMQEKYPHSQIEWKGQIGEREKTALLAQSTFFISASRFESFGISLLESIRQGCIPIVQRLPSFEEIIGNAPTCWIDFEKKEQTQLIVSKMIKVSSAKKKKMQHQLIQQSHAFDWKKLITAFEKTYQEVVKK